MGLDRCLGAVAVVNRSGLGSGKMPRCILGDVRERGSAGLGGMWAVERIDWKETRSSE